MCTVPEGSDARAEGGRLGGEECLTTEAVSGGSSFPGGPIGTKFIPGGTFRSGGLLTE
ncbi:hypothetical protein AGABI1DRAFT_113594 [Agaricus bisporus var. burnettii JB137-S8]|uniref:Uncharacterized protein n=1 Tax=Agaricus bisporus var. burnettii (strain JB137-S8 / ATCC MYA-4627 / FGSC 10392) TaxID=597362 RepID=K5WY17_AGABU|nr:uncharacterized protein AGABI1DRAFT_113594 [Agaricus bisporus var. burnettii JB137-S8]EKM80406.1 hypothetical protein AGABI1DRAFT_113594 [Agaricus bisporus var. burnettii JB137-S8]